MRVGVTIFGWEGKISNLTEFLTFDWSRPLSLTIFMRTRVGIVQSYTCQFALLFSVIIAFENNLVNTRRWYTVNGGICH